MRQRNPQAPFQGVHSGHRPRKVGEFSYEELAAHLPVPTPSPEWVASHSMAEAKPVARQALPSIKAALWASAAFAAWYLERLQEQLRVEGQSMTKSQRRQLARRINQARSAVQYHQRHPRRKERVS